ncbi:metal ABC transporter substrate-binding protein [Opitutaceae bacterium TAV5]|nr:metal ABC transporter substrate-binding protein [Opitutaceae bacterium TAV5]
MRFAGFFALTLLLAAIVAIVIAGLIRSKPVTAPGAVTASAVAANDRPEPEQERLLVLAGHASTFSLTSALAAGTAIDVAWAWPEGAVWADQAELPVSARAAQAIAVVTLREAAPEDALYAAARGTKIAMVEIDASAADDSSTLALRIPEKAASELAPAAPLSLANATRMAEKIARDCARLSPPDAARIEANLKAVKARIFRLRAEAEAGLATCASLDVAVASPVFLALAEDLGLFVRPAEAGAGGNGVAAVLVASGAADAAAQEAWRKAGVAVIGLDPLNRAPADAESWFRAMESNLAALVSGLGGRWR